MSRGDPPSYGSWRPGCWGNDRLWVPSLMVLGSMCLFEGSIDPNPRGRYCLAVLLLQPRDPSIAVHWLSGREMLRPFRLGGQAWSLEGDLVLGRSVEGTCGHRLHACWSAGWHPQTHGDYRGLLLLLRTCRRGGGVFSHGGPFPRGVWHELARCSHACYRMVELRRSLGKIRASRVSPSRNLQELDPRGCWGAIPPLGGL